MRGYFENRGWCILIWLMLVGLWLGIEWLANLLSLNTWVLIFILIVVGCLIYRFLSKGSPSEMKPLADVEPKNEDWIEIPKELRGDVRKKELDEKFCSKCGDLHSVRVTKDHKIVVYCSRCDE